MQAQSFMQHHTRCSRGLALLLTLILTLGLIQPAHAQSVTPGYVQAWGLDHVGQIDVPADLSDVIAVAASQVHSLALKSNGTVVAWGSNVDGQIDVPAGLSNVIAIAAGGDHSMALKSNGTVVAWGSNGTNQLDIPAGLNNVIAIAAGDFHSLALKNNGEVVAWGCGGGYDYDQCTVPATALSGVTAIGAGAAHSLALKGGSVIAWGINFQGQTAVPASATSGVVAIAAAGGSNHNLALKSNGAIVAWGRNEDGQTDVPAGLSGVVAIATGFNHSMALKSDGTLATWGNNSYGQTDVPAGLTGIVGMAGGWHTLVIVPPPSVTINQAATQADPTTTTPIRFTVTFSKPVTDFSAADVTLSGTAGLANATITVSGGPSVYTISVDGVTSSGTVVATIAANGATDANGYGNRASTSTDNSVTLNLNTSPPVITPNVVGTLGNNGWYVSDVSVSWSVVDNESPVTSQSGCGPQTVTADTSGVTFTCSAASAGGSSSQSVTIKRDATAPTITFANRTTANSNGWNNSAVTVNWSCSDATADVVSTSVSQTVSSEGADQSASGACNDNAGNSAPNTQNGINIDKTAPTVSAAVTTQPNANGWYNNDVTVHFTCGDALAGVATCPADPVLSSEGSAVVSTAQTSTDLAGNSSAPSNVVTVKLDKTAPTISAAATTPPNAAGWYNSDVTIRFTCADSLSAVTSCPADQTLSSEGDAVASTAQTITDLAGNSSTSAVVTVKIDKTAPTISAAATTPPNAAGWYNSNVTVNWSCSDATAGVVSANVSQTLSSDGANQSATGVCTDNAGNSSAPDTQNGFNIDKTAPTISAAATTPPNAAGWYSGDVTVHFTCADSLSGVTSCPADQTLSSEGAAVASTAQTITDQAGNSRTSNVVTVKIDKTAPTISAAATTSPNAAGWYNSNVTVRFTCTDALAGVANCPADQTLSSEGIDVTSTAQSATDRAGNTGAASNVVTVKVDKTPPVVTVTGVTSGATYPAGGVPTAGCTTDDALSGVATQANTTLVTGGNRVGTGLFILTCRGATDNAGNVGIGSVNYLIPVAPNLVVGWGNTGAPGDLVNVIAVASGANHSLALKADGTVAAWGANNAGQTNVPADLHNVIAIAAGIQHSLALKSDGTVVAWGSNSAGQSTVPANLIGVVTIAAGWQNSVAVKNDGSVVGWGLNNYGQSSAPAGLNDVIAIDTGYEHSVALRSDGTVRAWGRGGFGSINVPAGLNSVIAVAAGDYHTLALTSGGTVHAWGMNNNRQSTVPAGLNNVVAIAGGGDLSLALKNDGKVAAWGSNYQGERNVPGNLDHVITIGAGSFNAQAIKEALTVTINQAAGQADPTTSNPVRFDVLFSQAVVNFIASDVTLGGTANLAGATITISGGPAAYTVNVDGLTGSGTVSATLAANVATDANGYGNRASTSTDNTVGFNSDGTPPVITPTVVGTLGNNDWYTGDVNVTWSVVDNESTISNQSGCEAQNVTSDTAGVTFTCTAASVGGSNSQSVTIKRDATAPTITLVDRTAANPNGWNNGAVTVNWSCSDATAGVVAANASQTVSSEGANQTATGACTDNAGNSASNSQSGINIDKTAPTISAAATSSPNAAGWYNGNVTVHFTCEDTLSGVTSCPADETLSSEGSAVASTAQTITDLAGNSSTPSNVVTVQIDKTAPTISAAATSTPNAAGWYKGDVTIHFTCSDNLSGVVSCPADQVLSSEGAGVASTAQTISDLAGNNSAASNMVTVQIDKTAPVVTVTGVSAGASYTLGSVPAAGCSTTDALSGVATQATLSVTGGNADGTGSFTATCSGATDNAGNGGSASLTYIVAYNWTGFFQPVDNLPVVNTVNAGQAIPVKFSLGGDYGLNIFASGYPASQNVSCGGGGSGSTSPIEETVTAGNSSLQYDPGTQRYIYVWKTNKAWAGTCRQLIVRLIDGTDHIALFQFNGKVRSAGAEEGAEGEAESTTEAVTEPTAEAVAEATPLQQIFLPQVSR